MALNLAVGITKFNKWIAIIINSSCNKIVYVYTNKINI